MENETIQTVHYASFKRRLVSYLLDGLVINILTSIAIGLSGYEFEYYRYGHDTLNYMDIAVSSAPLSFSIMWLYYAFMESSKYQATLGKWATEIIVTKEDGSRLSFKDATVRFFSKILSCLTLGIGYLMVIWTKKKQGLHDKIARTVVIKK